MNATPFADPASFSTATPVHALIGIPSVDGMPAPASSAIGPSDALPVSWQDLAGHRACLLAFARRRLHDASLAEDAVHDVFEAVLSGRAAFSGRSSLRSWLTAILKHKVVDVIRQQAGWDSLDAAEDDDEGGRSDAFACPGAGPHEVAEHRQRLAAVLARIDVLPANLREVMQRRVLLDQATDEVCDALQISEQNLFVRLHRARKLLLS